MPIKSYDSSTEWVAIDKEYFIESLDNIEQFGMDRLLECRVYRDNNYKSKCRIIGESITINMEKIEPNTIGEIAEGINITGSSSYDRIKYSIESCYIINKNFNYMNLSNNPMEEITIDISVGKTEKSYQASEVVEPTALVEWYLSGVKIPFPRTTAREYTSIITRKRYDVDEEFQAINRRESRKKTRDFAFIKYNNTKFIIFKSLPEFGPGWSKNFAIEYRYEWGVPNEDERIAIAEIISFAFGT